MVVALPSWWTCRSINESISKSIFNVKANRCSTIALMVLTKQTTGEPYYGTVSQSLNIVYHSPAAL